MTLIALLFLLLVVYQLKHFLADYLLQGEYMLGKFKPGWDFLGPLCAHVAVHGVMTYLIAAFTLAFFVPYPLAWALLLGLGDATVHFFMDRIKASPRYMGRWKALSGAEYVHNKQMQKNIRELETYYAARGGRYDGNIEYLQGKIRSNVYFWWALGFDQMVHHLTHYTLIYLMLRITGLL